MTAALAELERVVKYAQRGRLPEWAPRPMMPWEIRAGVNFRALDDSMRAGYSRCAQVLDDLRRALIGSLARELAGTTDAKVITQRVSAWMADPPAAVVQAKETAKRDMQAALVACAARGGEQMRREAASQGVGPGRVVKAAARRTVGAVAGFVDPAELADEAALPVETLIGRIAQAAALASQRPSLPDAPLTAADNTSTAAALDLARQAVHIATGEGRVAAAAELPAPSEIYSSELLDENTCGPCESVDGTQYASLAEAEQDYPGQGPYVDCLGGARCRGTLVLVWDETAPPDAPPPDEPPTPDIPPPLPEVPPPPADAIPTGGSGVYAQPGNPPPDAVAWDSDLAVWVTKDMEWNPIQRKWQIEGTRSFVKPVPGAVRTYEGPRHALQHGLPQLAKVDTPGEAMRVVNTDHFRKDDAHMVNCQKTTSVYELRRRGADVKAAGGNGGPDDIRGIRTWWKDPDGFPPRSYDVDIFDPSLLPSIKKEMTEEKIRQAGPPDSRGAVSVRWAQGGSHILNWERSAGDVISYFDAQSGDVVGSENWFAVATPYRVFRLDNAAFVDMTPVG